ncbi:glycoside hydrolase family protein [Kitasatospora azatica]|uniref:family 43 glycosylhydrolase n=1 Tax=Kitasatospora azatica TaxID=58347 RepID=UPI000562F09B|nr:family 43 glycosylhydrolase [Kitasatospora azatica]
MGSPLPAPAPAPLYEDPVHSGPTDPVVIHDGTQWWMFYTQRRADVSAPGFAWVHGTAIGVATSADGREWLYRGVLDSLPFEPGTNTFWAPEVVRAPDGRFHMYVSYIQGVPDRWEGYERQILHYTSTDLWHWSHQGAVALSSSYVIDACVHPLPDGSGWRMWYKDEGHEAHTWAADSTDLHHWQVRGPVLTHRPHEGPNVFALGGWYWMIVDCWDGQDLFRSTDLDAWTPAGRILDRSGTRPGDRGIGHHADVVAGPDAAWVFYFTHPDRDPSLPDSAGLHQRRSVVQLARLTPDGDRLVLDRDTVPFDALPLP